VGPPADRDRTAERAPTSASVSAVPTGALRPAAMTTAVATMAVVAVVDGNAAQDEAAPNRDVPTNWTTRAA
jgi:hypothetical protein